MAYPVARIRSITSKIFRRLALCVGSDRPIPRGPDESPISDDTSGVVAKEVMEEIEDVLFLWDLWDI